MHTPQVPALPYMSPLGFQLLKIACRDCKRTTEDDSADHDTWIDGLCLYCQHAAAIESAPPMTPERAAEVQALYARAEAAAAIVTAAGRWRKYPMNWQAELQTSVDRYNALPR